MSAKSAARPRHEPRPVSSRMTFLLGGAALVVIAVLVGFGLVRQGGGISVRNDGYGTVRDPAVRVQAEPDGSIVLGKPGARKTLEFYEDAICPACGGLERTFGQEVAQAIDDGKLAVRYHFLDFLNSKSASGDYSTRAAAASYCVAAAGDGPMFAKFHATLFVNKQPAEGGRSDHTNQQLADLAKDAGAQEKTTQCIASGASVELARQHGAAARKALGDLLGGGIHTPAVLEGRREVDTGSADWVAQQLR